MQLSNGNTTIAARFLRERCPVVIVWQPRVALDHLRVVYARAAAGTAAPALADEPPLAAVISVGKLWQIGAEYADRRTVRIVAALSVEK
jgi:hypothetical protein